MGIVVESSRVESLAGDALAVRAEQELVEQACSRLLRLHLREWKRGRRISERPKRGERPAAPNVPVACRRYRSSTRHCSTRPPRPSCPRARPHP